jgi:leucyl aminopeptidase
MVHIKIHDGTIIDGALDNKTAGAVVAFCQENKVDTPIVQELARAYYPALTAVIAQEQFSGKAGSSVIVWGAHNNKPLLVMLGGLSSDEKPYERLEAYRRALGTVIRCAEKHHIYDIHIQMPDPELFDCGIEKLGQETVCTLTMAAYRFDRYLDDVTRKEQDFSITLACFKADHDGLAAGIERGKRVAYGVNQMRLWCDTPGGDLTPVFLAEYASKIAHNHTNLTTEVFDGKKIAALGMGGLAGVAQGSVHEPRFVIMRYMTDKKDCKTIGLVGKGITFDSGGLSLKPANSMEEMKADMAGAAAVISTMEACAHLKPDVNIVAVMPLAENMPSGTALKPGDVVRMYNGKTVEVKNTDAEGRLILADALSYIVKHEKLDELFSLATLTGACAYAVGPFFCALLSNHDDVAARVMEAGRWSGDRAWPLPLHADFKKAVTTSDIADLSNTGNERYRAGTIIGGTFLQYFVGDVPWVHLDIASVEFNMPDRSYFRAGATGFGVRLLLEYLIQYKE